MEPAMCELLQPTAGAAVSTQLALNTPQELHLPVTPWSNLGQDLSAFVSIPNGSAHTKVLPPPWAGSANPLLAQSPGLS